jgi:hypothetical protein
VRWSPTCFYDRRACGPEKFGTIERVEFFNKIDAKQKFKLAIGHKSKSAIFGAEWAGHMKSDPPIYKGNGSALRGKSNGGKIGLGATVIWANSV